MSTIIVKKEDLTTATVSKKYPLGGIFTDYSSTDAIKPVYKYVKAGSALTKYYPYQVSISNTIGGEVTTKAPATYAFGAEIGFPQGDVTNGYYAWIQTAGKATVATTDTVAAGDYVEVVNAGTGLKLDGGGTGSTAESVQSLGIATTATSGGNATVILSGNKVKIAAS